jgi:hypothetical protein
MIRHWAVADRLLRLDWIGFCPRCSQGAHANAGMEVTVIQRLQLEQHGERKRVHGVRRPGSLVLVVVALGLGIGATPAFARLAAISGKLSKPGYSLIALSYNGKAAVAKGPAFRVVPPEASVTLQLRGPNGLYAGPVVIARKGKWLVVGVKAGAKLGTVTIRDGYATIGKLPAKFVDSSRVCQQHGGVPLGNGRNFGFVRSKLKGKTGPGGDQDLSCVPNVFDIASDGKLILNAEEPSAPLKPSAHAAQASTSATSFAMFSQLGPVDIEDSVNADASTVTTAEIDAAMVQWGSLYMQVMPGESNLFDCGGLTFCSPGGTGHEYAAPGNGVTPISYPNEGPAFPACCDASSPNGLGNLVGPEAPPLTPGPNSPQTAAFALYPEATPEQIGSGDVLIQDVTTAGVTTPVPGTINFVFNTTPALASWTSGSDSATVTYPVAAGAPGTSTNPWSIGGGTGDVVVTLTFWRPQRSPIPPGPNGVGGDACVLAVPACNWIDVGHLSYESDPYIANQGGGGPGTNPVTCPASSYSTIDPDLVPTHALTNGYQDQANDAPANAANILTYSENLTSCFASVGATLSSGDEIKENIFARTPMSTSGTSDTTGQNFYFKIR